VVRAAIHRLQSADVRIFGAVLTRYRSTRSGSGYDYYRYSDADDQRGATAA
jgi:hypothetical protein